MIESNNNNHFLLQPEFEKTMNKYTDTHIQDGNKIILLPSGAQSYEMRWKLIEKAKHHIHIVAFSLIKDETSYRLRDLLFKKLRQNVKVRMIFDDGVITSTFSGKILKELQKAGAQTIRYHKIFRDLMPELGKGNLFKQFTRTLKIKLKRHFHEKYMVIDGNESILGGINWGNKYAFGGIEPEAWRDTDAYISGPVVNDIQYQFMYDFYFYTAMNQEYFEKRKPDFDKKIFYSKSMEEHTQFIHDNKKNYFPEIAPKDNTKIRYIPHKPYDENRLRLTDAYLLMFKEARQYIYWGCHGIRPPKIIAEALAEAAQRGVDVRLITNSKLASRTLMLKGLLGWMYWESSNHFRWLINNKMSVYEWQKPGAFHSKNLVIDDVVASVGSYNIARGSTLHHTESNIIVYGGDFPVQVRQQFEIDLQDCKKVNLNESKIVKPTWDPFKRILHERNLLINRELLTESVRKDLDSGKFKRM